MSVMFKVVLLDAGFDLGRCWSARPVRIGTHHRAGYPANRRHSTVNGPIESPLRDITRTESRSNGLRCGKKGDTELAVGAAAAAARASSVLPSGAPRESVAGRCARVRRRCVCLLQRAQLIRRDVALVQVPVAGIHFGRYLLRADVAEEPVAARVEAAA